MNAEADSGQVQAPPVFREISPPAVTDELKARLLTEWQREQTGIHPPKSAILL